MTNYSSIRKLMLKIINLILYVNVAFLLSLPLCAAVPDTLAGVVVNVDDEPLPFAAVQVAGWPSCWDITDEAGRFAIIINKMNDVGIKYDTMKLEIRLLGYKTMIFPLDTNDVYRLEEDIQYLQSVVITATEVTGVGRASEIGKQAMKHLQPSSFADIMELLPGGVATDPQLTTPNTIHIREVAVSDDNYSTTSLGTSFIVDNAPISSDANMQQIDGAWETQVTSRNFVNKGVDMRTISTDDIEKVEIVRGIPSVEYGNLTSGLVKITRKIGGRDFSARFKSDMSSKLFYAAKGFESEHKKLKVNVGADFLNAKDDPRNILESYTRFNVSTRFEKRWSADNRDLTLSGNLDYTGSFDKDKVDPELNHGAVDNYHSDHNGVRNSLIFNLISKENQLLKKLVVQYSLGYEHNVNSRTRLVQLQRDTPAALNTSTGVSDAVILPYKYTASHSVDGKPFNLFAKVVAVFSFPSTSVDNGLKLGMDAKVDKNFGQGQIFDLTRPLYPGISSRPRPFFQIPASGNIAMYAEEDMTIPIKRQTLSFVAGMRLFKMLNVDEKYALYHKIFAEPRMNVKWTFPTIKIKDKMLGFELVGGFGIHSKSPTMTQLYPDLAYIDLVQLNYFHPNVEYRRLNIMTYVENPVNYDLLPAKNIKWEVGGNVNYNDNKLSVTYFHEDMTSGFRNASTYNSFEYKKYDATNVDGNTLNHKPLLEELPFVAMYELRGFYSVTNGSRTLKQGVEYTFASRRFRKVNTRMTITGAYFKTQYQNSQPQIKIPSVIIDNEQIKYAGIYENDDGYVREYFNTNLTLDTDIQKLKMGLSISLQCVWYTASQTMYKSGTPQQYMDNFGNVHPYTEEDKNDTYLRWLNTNYSDAMFERHVVPFAGNVNFKATKQFFDNKLFIALFVNKILNYYPDYEMYGITVRRHATPYFGVEMNFKI